jgi:hypothetical protein
MEWVGAIGTALAIAVTATFGIDKLCQGRRDDAGRRRELEPHMFPASIIGPFAELRACVFAINTAIDNHYEKENLVGSGQTSGLDSKKRRKGFESSARIHGRGREAFKVLAAKVGRKGEVAAEAHRSGVVEEVLFSGET